MGKKLFGLVAALCLACCLVGCGSSGVPQEEYDKLSSEKQALEDDVSGYKSEIERLNETISSLEEEYEQYKQQMSQYEGLSEAEAQARQIEADAIIKAKEESEAAALAEEQAAREAEEKAGYDTGITYGNLARTPDDYEGKRVKFRGKVVQVIEGDDETQIRLAVNNDYDMIVLAEYTTDIVSSRVLENDTITIYGISAGLISYKSTLGGTITIPGILVQKIDQ